MEKRFYPVYPEGRRKAFTLSYDDALDCDIPLVEMMRSRGVRGTFNANSAICPAEPAGENGYKWNKLVLSQYAAVYGDDMEIAVHGGRHPYWNRLPTAQAMADIAWDRRALEQVTGKPVLGAAAPYGAVNDDVVTMLRLAGIRYCRLGGVTNELELPEQVDWLRFKGTCRHRSPKLMELAEWFVSGAPEEGKLFLFCVWGHTYEFVKQGNWHVMERLLDTVSGREDVWYATNLEIAAYLQDAERLEEDGNAVRNPTERDLWVCADETVIRVPAGGSAALG